MARKLVARARALASCSYLDQQATAKWRKLSWPASDAFGPLPLLRSLSVRHRCFDCAPVSCISFARQQAIESSGSRAEPNFQPSLEAHEPASERPHQSASAGGQIQLPLGRASRQSPIEAISSLGVSSSWPAPIKRPQESSQLATSSSGPQWARRRSSVASMNQRGPTLLAFVQD